MNVRGITTLSAVLWHHALMPLVACLVVILVLHHSVLQAKLDCHLVVSRQRVESNQQNTCELTTSKEEVNTT